MSDDSKSFEKKLDRDFLFYLNLTKELFDNIKTDSEKQLCEVWLNHLVGKTLSSIGEKCDRNIYLSRLLLQMQNGQLLGIFFDTPPSGVLPCAFTTFGLPSEVEGIKGFEESGFQIDNSFGGGSGDFSDASRDGRTYLATRRLPQGMMAYMAVTNTEGEEIWVPQSKQPCSPKPGTSAEGATSRGSSPTRGFFKKLLQYVDVPISALRRGPEEREKVLDWIDKIINDCNKWLQGEDPHNMDLEALFEILYQDYQQDPEKQEILKHKSKVRNILIRDIREKISERRTEILKRELVLDQYEADEYTEERASGEPLDKVWLQCAQKPLNEGIREQLEEIYPVEVVLRFYELLVQERIAIIEKGEREANRRIAELRNGSLDDIKNELQKLKKVQDEYKEYYRIFKEVEMREAEYTKECKKRGPALDKHEQETMDRCQQEAESQYDLARRKHDKAKRMEMQLGERYEDLKVNYTKLLNKMKQVDEKLKCERNQIKDVQADMQSQIRVLKKRRDDLRAKLMSSPTKCAPKK